MVNGHVQAKVVEKPRFTAIGDPELAARDPRGPNEIFVRTAQIRLLISLDAPVLDVVLVVLSGALDLLFKFLFISFDLLPPSFRVDIGVEVGGGEAFVKNYSCFPEKKISIDAKSSLVKIVAGKFGKNLDAAANNFFASSSRLEDMDKLNILDIRGYYPELKHYFGGLEVSAKLDPVSKVFENYNINASGLDKDQLWSDLNKGLDVAGGLKNTLKGIDIKFKNPSPGAPVPKEVAEALNKTVDALLGGMGGSLSYILAPIIDPLVNGLLWILGVDLSKMQVAGQLNCDYRADLVY